MAGGDDVYSLAFISSLPNTLMLVASLPAADIDREILHKSMQIYAVGLLTSLGIGLLLAFGVSCLVGRAHRASAAYFKALYTVIRDQKQVLDSVNDSMRLGLVLFSATDGVRIFNPEFAKICGGIPQDEATIPGPISAYGSTKLMGEKYVEQFCHRHFIVRTAWLYSYYGKNFVKTIVNAGKKFGKLEVVNDQCGNPTNAVDLAHEILQLCVTHEYGLYHCTGEGICSWYDFASEIIRLSGVDATVAPCTSEEYKAKHPDSADRPKWSALDNRMLRCTVGNDVRDWKDALACFFEHWDGDNGMKA